MTQTLPPKATSPTSDLKKRDKPASHLTPSLPLAKVLLIINPVAGSRFKRKKLSRIIAHLRRTASFLEIIYTTAVQDATRLIREKRKGGWTLLLCAGGDGTINEIINGMIDEKDLSSNHPPSPPLGILPTGTGNGLAREIGLPLDPWKAYRALLTGTARPVYLGKVTRQASAAETKQHRYFVLLAGAGFDGYVSRWVEQRKGFLRKIPKLWVYFFLGFLGLFTYRYPTLRFTVDGTPYTGSTGIVARARLIAGPFVFSPSSHLQSRSLVLCLVKPMGPLGQLGMLPPLLFRRKPGKGVQYVQGNVIEAAGDGIIQADGETIGPLPASFALSEKPIHLIYPM
jgi:diacylglycerol kinase family enzyme